MLSKTCTYAIQGAIYIALQPPGRYTPIGTIAEALNIPFQFLKKILKTLTQAGILASYRSPKGGVTLARAAENITLFDIVNAIDGSDIFTQCILKLPGCGHTKPCPLHDSWSVERMRLRTVFEQTSLGGVAEQIRRNERRFMLAFPDIIQAQ
jgi:Rrf2 family iron-sulfur cluster assembly transcriptional regulator